MTALITYLILIHISSSVFSIYVHRGMGHHHFEFKPVLHHIFRFWLWFFTAHAWHNWQQHYAAKHRKHHMTSDTADDPHSPYFYTFWQLLDVSHNDPKRANYISSEEVQRLAPDIVSPTDWIEQNIYTKYPKLGLTLFASIMAFIFGWLGLIIGLYNYFFIQASFIFFGNYAFHRFGWTYASVDPIDKSKILCPWGIFSGGEELHAHHHNDTRNPHFKRNWWEFDIGWQYARILMFFKLMRLKD